MKKAIKEMGEKKPFEWNEVSKNELNTASKAYDKKLEEEKARVLMVQNLQRKSFTVLI